MCAYLCVCIRLPQVHSHSECPYRRWHDRWIDAIHTLHRGISFIHMAWHLWVQQPTIATTTLTTTTQVWWCQKKCIKCMHHSSRHPQQSSRGRFLLMLFGASFLLPGLCCVAASLQAKSFIMCIVAVCAPMARRSTRTTWHAASSALSKRIHRIPIRQAYVRTYTVQHANNSSIVHGARVSHS